MKQTNLPEVICKRLILVGHCPTHIPADEGLAYPLIPVNDFYDAVAGGEIWPDREVIVVKVAMDGAYSFVDKTIPHSLMYVNRAVYFQTPEGKVLRTRHQKLGSLIWIPFSAFIDEINRYKTLLEIPMV